MEIEFRSCLYFTLTRLTRRMEEIAVQAFWATGFSPSLAFMQMYINDHSGLSIQKIASAMHLPESSIQRYLDQLETDGYIRKETMDVPLVFPQEKGLAINTKLKKCWKSLYDQLAEEVGGPEAYRHLLMATGEVIEKNGH